MRRAAGSEAFFDVVLPRRRLCKAHMGKYGAALETMGWPVTGPPFRTRADGVTSGEGFNRKRGVASFELFPLLFAVDCAIFFETGEDMMTGTSYLLSHLRKFDLKINAGSGTTASKTEAVYYPTSAGSYENGDTTPLVVFGPGGGSPASWDLRESPCTWDPS